MIYSLRGTVLACDAASVVVECGGVGYRCAASAFTLNALPRRGGEVFLYTFLSLRDDTAELFAFSQKEELDMFRMLLTVSGVGPKAALSVLSQFRPADLSLCVASGDSKTLTRAAGIGGKTAQRIVLELKDRVAAAALPGSPAAGSASAGENSPAGEAVGALVSLGYTQSEAAAAVGSLDPAASAEELIRGALRLLARRV